MVKRKFRHLPLTAETKSYVKGFAKRALLKPRIARPLPPERTFEEELIEAENAFQPAGDELRQQLPRKRQRIQKPLKFRSTKEAKIWNDEVYRFRHGHKSAGLFSRK